MEFVSAVHDLCEVLGMDFQGTVNEVHPSLTDGAMSKSISDDTLSKLARMVISLKEEKSARLQKVFFFPLCRFSLYRLL